MALGPSYRFSTDVLGEGELDGVVWRGDIVLKGYGDPTLSTLDLLSLASQLRSQGIRRVSGHVVGDESYFDTRRMGPGWKSYFFLNESPALSALVVDRGRYRGHLPASQLWLRRSPSARRSSAPGSPWRAGR